MPATAPTHRPRRRPRVGSDRQQQQRNTNRRAPLRLTQYAYREGRVHRFRRLGLCAREAAAGGEPGHWRRLLRDGVAAGASAHWDRATDQSRLDVHSALAFGKGWGDFDIQATIAAVLPNSDVSVLGDQIQTNIAFQYHLLKIFWPEFEVNWTYWADGKRGGLNQVFLTPGLVIGRFKLSEDIAFTTGVGYQVAVSPHYQATPLTPLTTTAGSSPRDSIFEWRTLLHRD